MDDNLLSSQGMKLGCHCDSQRSVCKTLFQLDCSELSNRAIEASNSSESVSGKSKLCGGN